MPTIATIAAAAAGINNSGAVGKAASNMWTAAASTSSTGKAMEVRNKSREHTILPELIDVPLVRTPLVQIIRDSYEIMSVGMSHVVYAPPSIGKTLACKVMVEKVAANFQARALMFTGAAKSASYLTHMANLLNIDNEEDVLAAVVSGMRTIPPEPASILILDEFNSVGADNCNIMLADEMMRCIYQKHHGIHLILVTQDKEVANHLCVLNSWQKIGPMNGLTTPTRHAVRNKDEQMPTEDGLLWNENKLEWSLENLTKYIDSHFPKHQFPKNNEGVIKWIRKGMTPTEAEGEAQTLISRDLMAKNTTDELKDLL